MHVRNNGFDGYLEFPFLCLSASLPPSSAAIIYTASQSSSHILRAYSPPSLFHHHQRRVEQAKTSHQPAADRPPQKRMQRINDTILPPPLVGQKRKNTIPSTFVKPCWVWRCEDARSLPWDAAVYACNQDKQRKKDRNNNNQKNKKEKSALASKTFQKCSSTDSRSELP